MKIVRSERGQASLMIGMMMMTFILLFAFVVNTGMLVNAKINLQNAADLAAYAGAAVQARQLNDISYLNYEMRRQYKKFLFRYYVVGNMASAYFPRSGGGSGSTPIWGPGPAATPSNYGVPAVCVDFSTTGPLDDYCQTGQLVGITIPNSNPLDEINQTLRTQLLAIEQLRELNCGKIAIANTSLLLLWLYNTDPNPADLASTVSDPNLQAVLQVSQAAAQGLGLVPREIILNERINTLASYVNAPPQQNVTMASVSALQTSIDPPSNERTIQAFLSAFYTLGNHTFDASNNNNIVMDELLPNGGSSSSLLALKPIQKSFDAYSVQFDLATATSGTDPSGVNANGTANCVPYLVPITVNQVPLGVYKDPSVLTFYAVRLKAMANVMFSPFGQMSLTAYAAARPFGSRIGPPDGSDAANFTFSLSPQISVDSSLHPVGALPNLPLSESDIPLTPGKGWDNNALLGTLYSQFFPGGAQTGNAAIDANAFTTGIRAAMVPNPIEGNVYNIMNDNGQDPFVTNFDSLHQISFWAPVISPANVSNLKDVLQADIAQIFSQAAPKNGIPNAGNSAQTLQSSLSTDITSYVEKLEAGQGEILAGSPSGGQCSPGSCIQEGLNLAHIQDPFVQGDGTPIQLGSSIMIPLSDSAALKTSYVTTNDPAIQAQGRVGYSVKFVSFDSLVKTGTDATGSGVIDKPSGFLDTQAEQDVTKMQH